MKHPQDGSGTPHIDEPESLKLRLSALSNAFLNYSPLKEKEKLATPVAPCKELLNLAPKFPCVKVLAICGDPRPNVMDEAVGIVDDHFVSDR